MGSIMIKQIAVFLTLFTTVNYAYAIGTTIAIGLGLTAAGALTATGIAVSIAINFALSFVISQILAPNFGGRGDTQQDQGVRVQVPPDTTTSIPIVYGDAFIGGKFVDAALCSEGEQAGVVMFYVMAVSCISPNGIFTFDTTEMYYGDRKITFDAGNPTKVVSFTDGAGNVDTKVGNGAGVMFINLYRSDYNGNITPLNGGPLPYASGTAFSMGVDSGLPIDSQWLPTGRRMNGLAFAIIRLTYSREAETTQLQPITFKVKQVLYGADVAKPGSVWYDYITSPIYGGAVDPEYVDADSGIALNDYSDGTITFNDYEGNPQTQARYRINGVINPSKSVLENIDLMLTASDSWMQYKATNGKWAIVINKAETSSYSFNDSNILGSITVGSIDITQMPNQVQGKFPDKTNRDQYNYVNLSVPNNLLYPNEPVNSITINYELVNDSVQALYLANRVIEQAREDLLVTIDTTYDGIQVDAGDVVSLTNAAYGFNNKLFRAMQVKEVVDDTGLTAQIQLTEYNAQVYDNFDITQYVPALNSDLVSPYFFPALPAPTIINIISTATIPEFTLRTVVPVGVRVTEVDSYYQVAASSGALTQNGWKLGPVQRPINGQAFVAGQNVDFVLTGIPPTPAGVEYFFAFIVRNELGQSNISSSTAGFIWSPAVISPTALATAYEWSPINLPIPTNSAGVPTVVGQEVSVYLRIGTAVIDIWDGTGTQPNNSWGISSYFTSTGLTLTGPVYNTAGDTATWTLVNLTVPSAYLSVSGSYKDSSGVVTPIGNTEVAVVQQVGGASTPTLTITWDPTNQIVRDPNGVFTPTPVSNIINLQMNFQVFVAGLVVGKAAFVLSYNTISKAFINTPGTYPGGNLNFAYFSIVNVGVATYGFTFQVQYLDTSVSPNIFAFNNGTVSVVESGASTVTSSLDKPNISLSSSTTGTVLSGLPNTVTMQILLGNVDDSTNWSFTTTPTNCTISSGNNTKSPTISAVSANSATVVFTATKSGQPTQTKTVTLSKTLQGATGAAGPTGATGLTGNKTATANLYQWSPTAPLNPNGSSTFTWATGISSSYTGTNGWSVTAPANPGTPLIKLWVAEKLVTGAFDATTSTVSWTSGFTVSDATQNGASGVQVASAIVYQWSPSIPAAPIGTSTYTWATGLFTAPSGWETSQSAAPSANLTLWQAKVDLTDSVSATTTTINWTLSQITASGYVGVTGAITRICYAKTNLPALKSTPTVITTAGDNTFPPLNSWLGLTVRLATTVNLPSRSGLLTIDGVVTVAGDRVLVKNQTTQANNGIYVVSATAWARAADANTWDSFVNLYVFVTEGVTQLNTMWNSPVVAGGTLGVTAITFNLSSAIATTWTDTVPATNAGETVYQSEGIYNPTTLNTIWNLPYIASVRFGSLSAITANLGQMTAGTITAGMIKSNTVGNYNGGTFQLGTATSVGGLLSAGAFTGNASVWGLLVASDSTNTALAGVTTSSTGGGAGGIFANATTSAYNTFRTNAVLATHQFAVVGNNVLAGTQGVVGYPGFAFYAGAGGYGPFTGVHDALLPNGTEINAGDIVVDTNTMYKKNINDIISVVQYSNQSNQIGILGVVSSPTALDIIPATLSLQVIDPESGLTETILDPMYDGVIANNQIISINAVGEGQINVCGENGNIAVGDLIVTSSIAGKGMKQSDDIIRSYTVAKAREAVTFSIATEVKMIGCSYISG